MKQLGFGILGCGVIGQHHARTLASLTGHATLVAAADRQLERARTFTRDYGGEPLTSLETLLAHPSVDAVILCTPSAMHADQAISALVAGKHVVIEKPVDVKLSAIDRLVDVQRRTSLKVAVISQHRFDPASRVVHQAMCDGRFGRLTLGLAMVRWWRSQGYYDSGDWRGTIALDGGGALMNQSIHTLDLLLWMMGPVHEVFAHAGLLAHERLEVEDTVSATMRFVSGALGVIACTTASYPGLTARLEVHGDRGSAVIDNDCLEYFHAAGFETEGRAYGELGEGNQAVQAVDASGGEAPTAGSDPAALSDAHRTQLLDFIHAIHEDREPLVSVLDNRASVALILALYESARTGRAVRLDALPEKEPITPL